MRRLVGCLLVLTLACLSAGCQAEVPSAVYSVKEYNPARDPAADLQATVSEAQAGKKRILLQIGGEWCSWCHKLDKYIAEHPAVAATLANNFIIMKVNYSRDENENAEFLSQYPKVSGYPYLFVLESDGTLLHPQSTGEFEEGKSYSEPALLKFLSDWKG